MFQPKIVYLTLPYKIKRYQVLQAFLAEKQVYTVTVKARQRKYILVSYKTLV